MSADDKTIASRSGPKELTREEAGKLREYYLALARESALSSSEQDLSDFDATDSTVAAFILPGD